MSRGFHPNFVPDLERDPRSKILRAPESLEDWELISIVLGSGTRNQSVYDLSRQILKSIDGISQLPSLTARHCQAIPGLGRSKTCSLLSISEIALRIQNQKMKLEAKVFPCKDLFHSLQLESRRQTRESFYLASFGIDGRLFSWERMAKGSMTEVGIYKRDLVERILCDPSKYCLLAHNHPGHSCQPSYQDENLFLEMTRLLQELEIICMDHWILGEDGLYSCRLRRVLNPSEWSQENIPAEYEFLADI